MHCSDKYVWGLVASVDTAFTSHNIVFVHFVLFTVPFPIKSVSYFTESDHENNITITVMDSLRR